MSSMLPSADAFAALTLELAKRMPQVSPPTKGARKVIARQGEPTIRIAYAGGTKDLWRLEKHQGGHGLNAGKGTVMVDGKPVPQKHRDPWGVESPDLPRDVALAKMETKSSTGR